MRSYRINTQSKLVTLAFLLCAHITVAKANQHREIQKSLVHLSGFATPETGDLAGEDDALESQATGFFIGGDGFILTAEHFLDPLKKDGAFNRKFKASIGDAGAGVPAYDVKFVTDLPHLDMVLLKADIPFGVAKPSPLKLGSSNLINHISPQQLYTSGFHGNEYRQLKGDFNKESSDSAPYVWSMNIKTNPGQSGSPVYLEDGTVVGLIKGVKREDDELTLVIPIEYSLPLIGHFRIEKIEKQTARIAMLEKEIQELKALQQQVENLVALIGENHNPEAPPIQSRLGSVEKNVQEISKQFFWSAETVETDRSLKIRYEKLVSDGPQIDKIDIRVKTNMRKKDDVISPGSLKMIPTSSFSRVLLTPDNRAGEFIIPDFQDSLQGFYRHDGNAAGAPTPYRDIELTVVPSYEGNDLSPKRIKLVPKYNWDY